jgi:hypothetical protein
MALDVGHTRVLLFEHFGHVDLVAILGSAGVLALHHLWQLRALRPRNAT